MKQKIIIPMFAGIGNALIAVPLLRLIKKHLPDCRITVLAGSPAISEVFSRLSETDDVVIARSGTFGLLRTGIRLRLQRYGIFVIPAPSRRWQYLLMAACIGARRTVMHTYTGQKSLIMTSASAARCA